MPNPGLRATRLLKMAIPRARSRLPVWTALGGFMGILIGMQLGCGGPDADSGNLALGESCEAGENPDMQLGRGSADDYAPVSDGDEMAFRATVEAGSDLELSMTLWGIASQILAAELVVADDELVLAEKVFSELEPLCIEDGSLLLPSLVLSFGSLGLIDLEDRQVRVTALVQGTELIENLETQIQVRLIASDEEYP